MRLVIFILFLTSIAFASTSSCWNQEINPRTQQTYQNESEYSNDLRTWNSKREIVNPILLARAYTVYVKERHKSLSLESDKMSHCYIGCRVRQVTDFKTVRYIAWLKEKKDLTDCSSQSHFEIKDFKATILGGVYIMSTPQACVNFCREELHRIM